MHKILLKVVVATLFVFIAVFSHKSAAAIDNRQADRETEIKMVSSVPGELLPGQILNLSFLITNNSDAEVRFNEELSLPEGFIPLFPAATLNIGPLQSQAALISLRVSQRAPAGTHQISYTLSNKSSPGQSVSVNTMVKVAAMAKLTMSIDEKPGSIIAGESFKVKVQIVNEGNDAIAARLKVNDRKDLRCKVEPAEISLSPGQATSVLVRATTRTGAKRIENLFFQLKALNLKEHDPKLLGSISIGTEVIPRSRGTVDLKRRLPTKMRIISLGEGNAQWSQIEIAGGGNLDYDDSRQVDFLLRTPGNLNKSIFGLRDEFHFDYLTDDLSVKAGDGGYSLSYLTNFYSYGRGLALDLNKSKATRLGLYSMSSHWEVARQKQLGVYVESDLSKELKLRINHFRHSQSDVFATTIPGKNINSLEVEYAPDERSSLKFERGQSRFTSGSSHKDSAYRLQYRRELPKQVHLAFDKIHAGPDYAGSVRDMDHAYVALEFPILDWVKARTRYSKYEHNLKNNRLRGSSPQETLWQFGLNFQLRHGMNFSFDFDRMQSYDRLIPANFDISEKAYRAALGKSWKRFELRWEVRHWRRSELVRAQETRNDSHSYFAVFRPSSRFFFSVYGGFSKNQARSGSLVLRDFDNLGISSRWQPSERFSLSFWYLKYNYSGTRSTSSQGNLALEYKLPNDSSIMFKARNNVSWFAAKGPVFYELSYSVPIDIPIGKNTRIGNLAGKIIDGELPEKPGIANVVLILGDTAAVTNQSGQFVFPAVSCGSHTLRIERKSVGYNRISSIKLPAEIMIKGGKTSRVEIAMLKGAQLKGQFVSSPTRHGVSTASGAVLVTGDVGKSLEKSSTVGLANILVELSHDGEITRRASDNYGEFRFDSLKPGTWHYKVYEQNIPENHRVKNAEGKINFAAGESKELSLEVLPRQRRIQIIDEGEIKLKSEP